METSGSGVCPGSQQVGGLIVDLIRTGRVASPEEVALIVEQMASAPFEPRAMRVPVAHRGLTYIGQTLGPRESSLSYHLVKRVLVDRGIIVTGYQISERGAASIPEGARWLR